MLGRLLKDLFAAATRPRRVDCRGQLTVGMAAYGNVQVTSFALECLFAALGGDFELILVDDNSPDGTLDLFRAAADRHPGTKLFHFPENKEYSGSLNAILSHATRPHVLFLSNDIFVTPGYLGRLLEVASLDERYGIVRGVSNFCDDLVAARNIPTPAACGSDLDALFRFGEKVSRERGTQILVDRFLTGDAFLVRRAVLERIGAIDTSFFGYFADCDFGVRARIAGFSQVTACGAFAYHSRAANLKYLDAESRRQKQERRQQRVVAAWENFYFKYEPVLQGRVVAADGTAISKDVNDLPWDLLSSAGFAAAKHYVAPKDYAEFRVR
jgi:GT2 family glycosyltransferase